MSRYRVEEPIPTSTTAHIYGPDGQVLGQIYKADAPEAEHLKRFIEAHDVILNMLRNSANEMHYVFSALWRSNVQDLFELTNQMDALVGHIDGKEAQ
jgi:hypothetical protein